MKVLIIFQFFIQKHVRYGWCFFSQEISLQGGGLNAGPVAHLCVLALVSNYLDDVSVILDGVSAWSQSQFLKSTYICTRKDCDPSRCGGSSRNSSYTYYGFSLCLFSKQKMLVDWLRDSHEFAKMGREGRGESTHTHARTILPSSPLLPNT